MDQQISTSQPQTQAAQRLQHPFWQHFSPRTLLLIVILIAITGGLLYVAVRQQQPQPQKQIVATPTPSPAHATISLVTQTGSTSALQTVAIMIRSNGNTIAGAQLAIAYDPTILSGVSVKPGTFFTNPTPLFNTIDKVNGRISYVLVIPPTGTPATGSGTLATISYTILPTAQKTTAITFLPKTELTQEGISGTVLKSAADLTIAIPQSLQLKTTTTPVSGAAK